MKYLSALPLFLALALTVTSLVNASSSTQDIHNAIKAQTDMTILEYLASQPEKFTILAVAAGTVPGLLDLLNNSSAQLTLFPPTDDAFIALASLVLPNEDFSNPNKTEVALGIAEAIAPLEQVDALGNPTLESILAYHLLGESRSFADLEAQGSATTVEGSALKFAKGAVIDADPTRPDPIPDPKDVVLSNGRVHVIGSVLLPFSLADVPGVPLESPDTTTPTDGDGVAPSEADDVPDAIIPNPRPTILGYLGSMPDKYAILAIAAGTVPGLVELLNDPTGRLTLFPPSDAAFFELAKTLAPDAELMADDKEGIATAIVTAIAPIEGVTLEKILQYHLIAEAYPFQTLEELGEVATAEGSALTFKGGAVIDLDPSRPDPIAKPRNILARNGWIHAIDSVLLPFDLDGLLNPPHGTPTETMETDGAIDPSEADDVPDAIIPDPRPTILGYLASLPDEFGVLARAAALIDGLPTLLDTPSERLTLFPPTDQAFANIGNALNPDANLESSEKDRILSTIADALAPLEEAGIASLGAILSYHLLTGAFPFQELQAAGSVPTALEGASLTIEGTLVIDIDTVLPDANAIRRNVFTQNGWVHVIDAVLLPIDLASLPAEPLPSPTGDVEETDEPSETSPDGTTDGDDDDPVCFPGSAQVRLEDGSALSMSSLKAGHSIHIGMGKTSKVFAFTHKMDTPVTNFFELTTASGHTVSMTAGHYLYANDKLTAASAVRVGDVLRTASGSSPVVTVRIVKGTGLYAPHTLHGDLEVNGVIVSGYSRALHPSVAHALLAPVRALTKYGGFVEPLGSLFYGGADSLVPVLPKGARRY